MSEVVVPDSVLRAYGLVGARVRAVSIGWINRTFVAESDGAAVVLQRLHPIFGGEVNLDLDAITTHLDARGLETPRLVRAVDDRPFVESEGVWRALTFLPGRTLDALDPTLARSAGDLAARFHRALSDLEHTFHFTRPGAHDTRAHLEALRAAHEAGLAHPRRPQIERICGDILEAGARLPSISGLPSRIIHGDLKATNLLFEEGSDVARAIVDLDTLAHGTIAVELGDALRSWCNRTSEADPEARFDVEIFAAAIDGYAAGSQGFLTPDEIGSIVDGVEVLCVELASRFAKDLYEDRYFGWDPARFETRVDHNLARCHAQLGLGRSVRTQRDALRAAVDRAFRSR